MRRILEEEDDLIAAHRWQIEETMAIVRQEMSLLGQVRCAHLPAGSALIPPESSALHSGLQLMAWCLLERRWNLLVRQRAGVLALANAAAQIDQPGSAVDAYIEGLRDVLERKAANIAQLQGRLESFQACTLLSPGSDAEQAWPAYSCMHAELAW
jgi:hypothetical protein